MSAKKQEVRQGVYRSSSHMEKCFEPGSRKKAISCAVKAVQHLPHFDAIAYSGHSGAVWASLLAHELDKPLILVRKPNDDSHSLYKVEGMRDAGTYIIVDDFICSGKTYNYIRAKISEEFGGECLGCLCIVKLLDWVGSDQKVLKSYVHYWFQKSREHAEETL